MISEQLFIYLRLIAPSTAQGHLRPLTNSNLALKKAFNIQLHVHKNKHFLNLKIALSVLPLCPIAIKLGHAGIVDLSV